MNQTILNPIESSSMYQLKQFPPTTTSSATSSPISSSLSSSQDQQPVRRTSSSKTRVSVIFNGREEFVSWYGSNTPSQTIEEAIKTVFQLPSNARLFLKDQDGDIVAIAPTLPAGETFTLYVSNAPSSSSSSPKINSSTNGTNGQDDLPTSAEDLSSSTIGANGEKPMMRSSASSSSSSPEPLKVNLLMDNDDIDEISGGNQKRVSGDLSSLADEEDDDDDPRKKRKRRKAVEIDRSFKCSMANCQKIYGSENALKMHIKLKHPEYQYLIMQQQIPLTNKTSPPIIVNNKMLSYNTPHHPGYVVQQASHPHSHSHGHPMQNSPQYQQYVQQTQYQQAIHNSSRVPTSLLFQQQQQQMQQQPSHPSQMPSHPSQMPSHQSPPLYQQSSQQPRGIPPMKLHESQMNPRDIYLLSKQYTEQQQYQQQQQYGNSNSNNSNSNNSAFPKLFNSQVPTSELKSQLASFLAKERLNQQNSNSSNNNSNNREGLSSQHLQSINKIISATNIAHLLPSNLHPAFFQSFQQQLDQLFASNPGMAQDILSYDYDELSSFIKKQIEQVKLKQEHLFNKDNNKSSSSNRLPNFNYEEREEERESFRDNNERELNLRKREREDEEEELNNSNTNNGGNSRRSSFNRNSLNNSSTNNSNSNEDSEYTTPSSSPINRNLNNSKNILPSLTKGNLSFLVSNAQHSDNEEEIKKSSTCTKNESQQQQQQQTQSDAASLLLGLQNI